MRSFSTSAVSRQLVKTPIQVFGLEGRYAAALYSAATKLKQLEAAEKDLIGLQQSIRSDVNFRDLIVNPIIQRKVMMTAIKETGEKIKLTPATTNLLVTLAENGRMKKLDSVISAFRTIMAAHRGEVVCEVTSAKPLEAGQKSKLENSLKVLFIKSFDTIFDLNLYFYRLSFLQIRQFY